MQKRASALARILAVLALAGAVVAVVVVISATTGGSSSTSGGNQGTARTTKQKQKQKKPKKTPKTYVIKPGDTLTSIAHKTGVPVARIEALNPGIDPQILIAGETLKLR